MIIDHVAIWTAQLEQMKDYYIKFFNGRAGQKYINETTYFESYFVTFDSGTRLELMMKPDIPENLNDRILKQHQGFIHLAFGTGSMEKVNEKYIEFTRAGFKILRGPRKTGDGYWEFETLDPDNNRIEVSAAFIK
jgi:lactoylglutathione lyase